jgi:chromate transporter
MSAHSLTGLALVFVRLGATSFGGPAVHIAMMEDEIVRRRRWLRREEFLDYLGATNLIPGPNSTELAIHIGRVRAGWPGLVVAGVSFILPAAVIVAVIGWGYVRYGVLPAVGAILYGVKPVVTAVIAQALWALGRTALTRAPLVALAAAAAVAVALGVHELLVLAAAAIVAGVLGARPSRATVRAYAVEPLTLMALFLVLVKIGAVLFGSGYVLLAFLRADLVERLGWLTEQQLFDAVAVGQITPGPVFTTATFIGYVLGGPAGAAVATVAIFLPAFVFVAVSGPIVPRLRRSRIAAAVLDGVNAASVALMAVVSWHLARAALVDPLTVALAVGSLVMLIRYRVNSAWLIFVGALAGWITAR